MEIDEEEGNALPALAGHYYDGNFIYDTPISTPTVQASNEEKPGGPRHVAGTSRTENIRVRLTPAEKAQLQEAAKKAGMLVGEFIRWKLWIAG